MRRQTILAGAQDGHPFRSQMKRVRASVRRREDDGDIRLFMLSYAAFFVCFYTFLL
jgi:hypothetical protein